MQDYTKLRVWQRAQGFTVSVYACTEALGEARAPGMRSQLRRAAASIASNVAEGAAQATPGQFARYLQMAIASATEVRSQLDLLGRLAVMEPAERRALETEAEELTRMLVVTKRVRAGG